jgi:signal transduction histidine kinase
VSPAIPVGDGLGPAGAWLITAAATLVGTGEPGSPWRHLWAVPVALTALRFGLAGGAVAAVVAVMVQAPAMLVHLERFGPAAPVVEELLTAAHVLALGPLLGALTTEARRQRRRVEMLLDLQAVLADEPAPEAALERVRACLAARLAADVALAVREGERWLTAGDVDLGPESPAAAAARTGRSVFIADTGDRPRPHRALAAPLSARGQPTGALVVTREGEVPAAERRAIAALAAHVGLALENVRLAARQRRFADELAERVREATDRLLAMDRLKSHFVAVASHELRTPLTALLGFAELLATRPAAAEEVCRRAGLMWRQTRRLARIVDDLLDLTRLERGAPLDVAPVPVPVQPALQSVAELFQGGLATHEIVVDCSPDVPAVRADPQALDRILGNLLSNAVKYAPRGTRVTLRARGAGARVVITVEDEGPGIPPAVAGRVFEPYFRAAETAAGVPGSGLGLAVVKALVEAQHGTIALAGEPGRGTRVTLELPAVP